MYPAESQENLNNIDPQAVAAIVQNVLDNLGVPGSVEIEQGVRGYVFNISSPDSSLLIGKQGANLHAMQSLVHSIVLKKFGVAQRFFLDVDDYYKKREWYLRELAKKAVQRVTGTGRPVSLEPMNAHERRVIHAYLSEDNAVDTESIGVEPYRKIVIRPKVKGDF